jgi:hypothetical protein
MVIKSNSLGNFARSFCSKNEKKDKSTTEPV